MATPTTNELRIALTVADYDAAVEFYRRVLGAELTAEWDQPAGRGGIFTIDRATLEILDAEMAAGVDAFEVGERVSGTVRLALGVHDVRTSVDDAVTAGADLAGPAQDAPWGDLVARVVSPDGMQLTLFGPAER